MVRSLMKHAGRYRMLGLCLVLVAIGSASLYSSRAFAQQAPELPLQCWGCVMFWPPSQSNCWRG